MSQPSSRLRPPVLVVSLAAVVLTILTPRLGIAAQGLTFPPNGDNPQASVMQAIGPVRVTIDYSSPRVVRGCERPPRKNLGELVPWGLSDLGLNGCTECPWRGGANENTTFTVTHAVKVQGQPLPAGRYGLQLIPGKDDWTVIFSKDADSWGSYWYDARQDALRVTTKAAKSDYHEWLTYEFTTREPAKVTAALKWEELQIPFTVSVDDVNQLWVDDMRRDLRGWAGFSWQSWQQAADFCAQNNVDLPEGLKWAERAVSDPYSGGQNTARPSPPSLASRPRTGRPTRPGRLRESHQPPHRRTRRNSRRRARPARRRQEGRSPARLADQRETVPRQWPVHVGLMRGYSAMGDQKKALAEAKLALAQAPDDANKRNLEGLVKQLEQGKALN